MNDSRFRLIFEGLDENAKLRKLVIFFQKELRLSEDKIRNLLTSPPRILWEVSVYNYGELIQTALEKIGCRTYLEPLVADSSCPFAISKKHHKVINQELTKILRCRATLALFLVQVEAGKPQSILPSMIGPFEEKLVEHFRESDTVIGIDDGRIIILGFSTGRQGVRGLQRKIDRVLKEHLGEDIHISIGFSLFPQEGRSLPELIHIAELKRIKKDSNGLPETQIEISAPPPPSCVLPTYEERPSLLQLCFTKARGKIFKRLLNMDPQTLWLGLSQLPQAKQNEFLARLPFNSPVVPILEKMINTPPQPTSDKVAEQHFEAIIHQMELEKRLEQRKETQEEVLSKLDRVGALPTLPSIAAQIFKIASNPNSSANDLTKAIENDPFLTSKLLKIVNSAFYGFPQNLWSVTQAVVILGTDEIMSVAFGLAAAKVFEVSPYEGLYHSKGLRHHSICTALIAHNLCRRFPEYRKVGVFTAGLLHDFGKIFLLHIFPELYAQMHLDTKKQELPLFELEEERFGLNHAVIGKFLATKWKLPDPLIQSIAFHHQPFSASSHSQLAAIIGLADYLYYEGIVSAGLQEEVPVLSPQLTFGHWSLLSQLFTDLNTQQLKKMKQDAVAAVREIEDLFAVLG